MDLRGYKYPQSDFVKKHYYDGQRAQLRRQLTKKFGELPPDIADRIERAQPEDLALWSDQFVDADSLDAVFATDA